MVRVRKSARNWMPAQSGRGGHSGLEDVRVRDHVVRRTVRAVPERPQVPDQPGETAYDRYEAERAQYHQLGHQLAEQRRSEVDRGAAVADDPDRQCLLAPGLPVVAALPA